MASECFFRLNRQRQHVGVILRQIEDLLDFLARIVDFKDFAGSDAPLGDQDEDACLLHSAFIRKISVRFRVYLSVEASNRLKSWKKF